MKFTGGNGNESRHDGRKNRNPTTNSIKNKAFKQFDIVNMTKENYKLKMITTTNYGIRFTRKRKMKTEKELIKI